MDYQKTDIAVDMRGSRRTQYGMETVSYRPPGAAGSRLHGTEQNGCREEAKLSARAMLIGVPSDTRRADNSGDRCCTVVYPSTCRVTGLGLEGWEGTGLGATVGLGGSA
jgi:hypothetical protein